MPAKERKKYPLVTVNVVTDERLSSLERQARDAGCVDVGEYLRRVIDRQEEERNRQEA